MDISANYKSGIFLGVGVLFFIVSILIVDSDGNLFERKFEVYSLIDNSQGLAEGSIVSFAGLTVGNISKLEFSPEQRKVKVTLSLKRKFQEKIPKDSLIDVRTQGALGDKYIFITPGDFSSGQIEDGNSLQAQSQEGILEIIGKRGSDTERFFDLIIELQKFAKNLNEQNIPAEIRAVTAETRKTLQSLQSLTQELQQKTLTPLSQSVSKLNSVMEKVDRGQGTLGKLINDPTIFDQARRIMGGRSAQNYFDRALSESVK
jgi:phospholipid/cholesterol/gamma-HCH transport system substrate-binding protein